MSKECRTTATDTATYPLLVSCAQAGRMLGATPYEVYNLCNDGGLEHGRIGRRIVIRPEAVRAYAHAVTA